LYIEAIDIVAKEILRSFKALTSQFKGLNILLKLREAPTLSRKRSSHARFSTCLGTASHRQNRWTISCDNSIDFFASPELNVVRRNRYPTGPVVEMLRIETIA
jgi:hypothetical protein